MCINYVIFEEDKIKKCQQEVCRVTMRSTMPIDLTKKMNIAAATLHIEYYNCRTKPYCII
jgi:hypothetical protein